MNLPRFKRCQGCGRLILFASWTRTERLTGGWKWYHTTCFEDRWRGVATIGKLL